MRVGKGVCGEITVVMSSRTIGPNAPSSPICWPTTQTIEPFRPSRMNWYQVSPWMGTTACYKIFILEDIHEAGPILAGTPLKSGH